MRLGLGRIVVSAVAAATVTAIVLATQAAACGGGSCKVTSRCANDPQPTDDQLLLCNNRLADPKCGGYYSAMIGCTQGNQQCLANGTTDFNATNAPCNDAIAAWTNCHFGTTGSPPTTPDGG